MNGPLKRTTLTETRFFCSESESVSPVGLFERSYYRAHIVTLSQGTLYPVTVKSILFSPLNILFPLTRVVDKFVNVTIKIMAKIVVIGLLKNIQLSYGCRTHYILE